MMVMIRYEHVAHTDDTSGCNVKMKELFCFEERGDGVGKEYVKSVWITITLQRTPRDAHELA